MMKTPVPFSGETALATFAAGCFRCSEAAFQEEPGVVDAIVWYAGWTEPAPTYEAVSSHQTSHREAVQVTYDPTAISYQRLLEIFRQSIDPTDPEGQFVDKGFQYTTAVFYHTDEQRQAAQQSLAERDASGMYDKPIVTKILPFTTFYPAEEYHQDFYKHSAERYKRYKKWSWREEYYEEMEEKETQLPASSTASSAAFTKPTDEELRSKLTPMQYVVTQEWGTETPFNNEYRDTKADGIYVDVVTGEPLFSSLDKYDSGTGRPSFTKPIDPAVVKTTTDTSHWMTRTEIKSASGDSHLGHVFADGPKEAWGQRFCTNSASLRFVPKESMEAEGYGDWLYLFWE